MQKYNLNDLIEYDTSKINPKILINQPGYRVVLMSMSAGQSTPNTRCQAEWSPSMPCMAILLFTREAPLANCMLGRSFLLRQALRTEFKPMRIQPSWF